MALDLQIKVFARMEGEQLESVVQRWLDDHRDVAVRFISQSEHSVGKAQYVTLSLFYTEPSDQERTLQAQMRAQHARVTPDAMSPA